MISKLIFSPTTVSFTKLIRSVHFTKSQRDNVQLVLDDFILKKKKGPFLSRGMQVIINLVLS